MGKHFLFATGHTTSLAYQNIQFNDTINFFTQTSLVKNNK